MSPGLENTEKISEPESTDAIPLSSVLSSSAALSGDTVASVPENEMSKSHEVNNPLSVLSNKHGLKMAHLNIRTLPGSFDQVEILLPKHPVDVIAFSETRLDETISDSATAVDNYQIYGKDRNRNGGEVLI